MAFQDYIYESDDGSNSYLIRLDTRNATLAGAVVGTPSDAFHVIANGSRRRFGINPRHILVSTNPTDPTLKAKTTRLAICTEAAFDAISVGATVSVSGTTYQVNFKSPETKR